MIKWRKEHKGGNDTFDMTLKQVSPAIVAGDSV